jgi:RNA polymerase sigma factor (sigma-70 family)
MSIECRTLLTNLLQGALAELRPEDRLLLLLAFVEGLEGRQIAGVLGIDPGNVSRRKARALEALRQRLG